jgi:hypothetical protein
MFAPGQTHANVPVTIKSDTLDEYDELFLVSFHNVANARLGGVFGLGFGGIVDDDALPTIVPAFGTPSVLEGATDAQAAIHVALSAASGRTVKAHYTMPFAGGDGVAEPGVDYDVASGDVVFAPGTTSVDIPVTVHGDTIPEEDELVGAVLSSPTNATVGGVYGIGALRLVNDD